MIRILYKLADGLRHRARLRRWNPEHASGRRGEDLAHRFLQDQGLRVVARNYRTRSGDGEIDLVAWDGDTLAFVEVKSRKTGDHGTPDRAVDREKQHALIRTARDYARRGGVEWTRTRFDVVNVVFGDTPAIWHIKDAFPRGQAL
ncbi:MAG: YraN family protein [Bryobacteraceae bacterium]